MKRLIAVLVLVSNIAFAQTVPDYDKEARWASFVEDGLMDGDVVWIQNGDREFLSIFTEAESDSTKVAIIMHGLGVHPDWTGVIQPLRVSLTEQGYHTLSIQLPVLANGIAGNEYKPLWGDANKRIDATINYIQSLGKSADLLVAHSHGTRMARHYLADNPKHPFKKFVSVGMGDVAGLKTINIPMLDLYGTEDLESVLKTAKKRREASSHNSDYEQKQITGDHFFNDQNDLLNHTVINWLK